MSYYVCIAYLFYTSRVLGASCWEPFSSPDQRPRTFRSVSRIATAGRGPFSEHAQSNRFVFLASQICYTWTCAEWREVRESQTWNYGAFNFFLSCGRRNVLRLVALGMRMIPVLNVPKGWCWPKGAQPPGMRMQLNEKERSRNFNSGV